MRFEFLEFTPQECRTKASGFAHESANGTPLRACGSRQAFLEDTVQAVFEFVLFEPLHVDTRIPILTHRPLGQQRFVLRHIEEVFQSHISQRCHIRRRWSLQIFFQLPQIGSTQQRTRFAFWGGSWFWVLLVGTTHAHQQRHCIYIIIIRRRYLRLWGRWWLLGFGLLISSMV